MTIPITHKAFAYITNGSRLLVISHPFQPEAGIQVPAGTVRPLEDPKEAVLREAYEETGLYELTVERFLGEQYRTRADHGGTEIHHRRFYHLRCHGVPPERWRHFERDPSDGGPPIAFDFFWVELPDGLPELAAEHAFMMPRLLEVLRFPS